jgi:predicted 3-demethylubiquinone-9 3-methyltransferase (glyoxalase superfamily)
MYINVAQYEDNKRTNLILPGSYYQSKISSPVFFQMNGVSQVGTLNGYNSGFVPSVDCSNFTLTDCCFWVYNGSGKTGASRTMAGMDGKVLTAVFELNGDKFMALDGGPYFKPTGAVSFLIECKTQEEIDYYWDKLTNGGDPTAQQCGWLLDKYGFSWQVVPDMSQWINRPDSAGSARAMQAMLGMKKIIIADLEKAYNG